MQQRLVLSLLLFVALVCVTVSTMNVVFDEALCADVLVLMSERLVLTGLQFFVGLMCVLVMNLELCGRQLMEYS